MNVQRNWLPWAGFAVSIFAFLSYFFVFARFPITRDVPWANFILFAVAELVIGVGVVRAFRQPQVYRGKISGVVLSFLSTAVLGFFVFSVFVGSRNLPRSHGAPQVGQRVPEFSLNDPDGKQVSLAELLATPLPSGAAPKGVLLVFYRGYW